MAADHRWSADIKNACRAHSTTSRTVMASGAPQRPTSNRDGGTAGVPAPAQSIHPFLHPPSHPSRPQTIERERGRNRGAPWHTAAHVVERYGRTTTSTGDSTRISFGRVNDGMRQTVAAQDSKIGRVIPRFLRIAQRTQVFHRRHLQPEHADDLLSIHYKDTLPACSRIQRNPLCNL